MDNVYNTIRNLRIQYGYSQDYIAEKIGMNQGNYGRLEKGVASITVERLQQIAEAFGLQASDLLGESKKMAESKKELQKRIVELEEQLLDKKRLIDAVKGYFKLEVNRLYDTIPQRYQTTITTPAEAHMYAEKYSAPELLKQFEAAATEENGKKTYHPIHFLAPEAREQAEELIFEELRPFLMFFDLHLINEELEDTFNLTEKWKKYVRRHQGWKYRIGSPEPEGPATTE